MQLSIPGWAPGPLPLAVTWHSRAEQAANPSGAAAVANVVSADPGPSPTEPEALDSE